MQSLCKTRECASVSERNSNKECMDKKESDCMESESCLRLCLVLSQGQMKAVESSPGAIGFYRDVD